MLPTDQALPLLWNWESEESLDDDASGSGPTEGCCWLMEQNIADEWLLEDGSGCWEKEVCAEAAGNMLFPDATPMNFPDATPMNFPA